MHTIYEYLLVLALACRPWIVPEFWNLTSWAYKLVGNCPAHRFLSFFWNLRRLRKWLCLRGLVSQRKEKNWRKFASVASYSATNDSSITWVDGRWERKTFLEKVVAVNRQTFPLFLFVCTGFVSLPVIIFSWWWSTLHIYYPLWLGHAYVCITNNVCNCGSHFPAKKTESPLSNRYYG